VEGRIQTRQWEDQTGAKRYTTELIANQVTSLERRERDEDAPFPDDRPAGGGGASGGAPSGGAAERPASPAGDDEFDDLPF
jgi:single-strand DNA-binding protein